MFTIVETLAEGVLGDRPGVRRGAKARTDSAARPQVGEVKSHGAQKVAGAWAGLEGAGVHTGLELSLAGD